ncbi:hypothetical protein K9M48_04765 [Candidatus Gracilibacteria bacterium]|nr:hypothetical protein [Candidatus Gracilibacteria bacterium]
MKKIILLSLVVFSFVLIGCGSQKLPVDQNQDINEKIMLIQQKLVNGNISKDQAQEMIQNVSNYTIKQIENAEFMEIENVLEDEINVLGLPERAKKLGLREAEGLVLDQSASRISSKDNPDEGFDSVILVYKGDYQKALDEASNIALEANIPLNKDFQKAKEIEEKSPDIINQMSDEFKDSMKGIVYSNYDLIQTNIEYLISISVDGEGTLVIDASNYKQMQELIKN